MNFPYLMIDLTHPLNEKTVSWNGGCGFQMEIKLDYQQIKDPVKFRIQKIKMHAGIGTHMDAPAHCIPGGAGISDIALEDLIIPAVVIDVSHKMNAQYRVLLDDIEDFENQYGQIEPGSLVIFRTGWDKYWENPIAYRNNLQFPSVSSEVAQLMVDRKVKGIAIDTLSPDLPGSGYPVHQIILESGRYIIENIANSISLPRKGFWVATLPAKIEGATESAIRTIGLLPKT